ncbi:MAG TPA: PIN domain-containing protein [Thermoanaerobaculia bacterium]|nr:PIN domain-containing protein [Thermoanaerobaculia bacterium]
MNLYAESSAVLSWLLGEPAGETVREILATAEIVLTSELTLIECDRALHRGRALEEISEANANERRATLAEAGAAWHRLKIDAAVVARAREPFPVEPIRTLDALHLASALEAAAAVPEIRLLALDRRVRECGAALGFRLAPELAE